MPRLTSYMVILLALVSFAQAGPFGLKGGMTADEILKAGFKTNEWKAGQIAGHPITSSLDPPDHNLEGLQSGKGKPDPRFVEVSAIHDKYPNFGGVDVWELYLTIKGKDIGYWADEIYKALYNNGLKQIDDSFKICQVMSMVKCVIS